MTDKQLDTFVNTAETDTAGYLVAAILKGDPRAEAEFVKRYRARVVRLLLRKGREVDAEDLANDALMCVLERVRRDGLKQPDQLPNYLMGVARNLAIAAFRKESRRNTHCDTEAIDRIATDHLSPAKAVIAEEANSELTRNFGRLRQPRDAEVLQRYYMFDEDKDQICKAMGLERKLFNNVLYRARQRLGSLLEQGGERYATFE